MLNSKERHRFLELLRHICSLKLLPLDICLESWEIGPVVGGTLRAWTCKAAYASLLAHSFYQGVTFAHVLLFCGRTAPLYQILMHGEFAVGSVMLAFWYYVSYIKYPFVNAALWRMTLTGDVAGGQLPNGDTERKELQWHHRLRQCSLQDLIAKYMLYMVSAAALPIFACFIYYNNMSFLLFAALPERYQTWPWFVICFAEEVRYFIMLVAIAVPTWQFHVMAFDFICSNLEVVASVNIDSGTSRRIPITQAYRAVRCIQLYIQLVNTVHRHLIFTWKLLCLGVCIMSGYAAIAHFSEHPIFGVFYYVMLVECGIIYAVIYEKAFKVPALISEAKIAFRLRARGIRNQIERNVFERQVKSIPSMGITVGQFHTLERTSTPVFVGFVLVNIVNMLVAYA